MVTFNDMWRQLYEHGSTTIKQQACAELWDSLTEQQQEQLYSSISDKLRQGRFVHYDPLRAMEENIRQELPASAPTNYFGRQLPRGKTYYKADYRGQRGLYTEEDVKAHRMANAEEFIRT